MKYILVAFLMLMVLSSLSFFIVGRGPEDFLWIAIGVLIAAFVVNYIAWNMFKSLFHVKRRADRER